MWPFEYGEPSCSTHSGAPARAAWTWSYRRSRFHSARISGSRFARSPRIANAVSGRLTVSLYLDMGRGPYLIVAGMERASWDEYFMSIAQVVATRSTCPRKFVGAVIVRNRTILSTGYNGSIRGMPHCSDVGHMMEDGHCVATIHAEANAIIQAARNGVNIDGAICYATASPCWNCFKQLANAGVVRICYGEFYRDDRIFEIARQIGIELVHVPLPGVTLPRLPPQGPG